MRLKGFDPAFPIILWNNVVIDGHTRLKASIEFGLFEVPVIQKEFADEHEALEYAIHNQRARRNITEAELLKCIQAVDNPMTKEEAGKKGGTSKLESKTASETSHKKTAKTLGISESKVSDARAVLTDVEAVQKVESGEKISMVAKEVREKKKKGKPVKEKVVENPTRIKSVCGVLKFYAESDMPYEDVLIEANEYFHENGGTSNMAETTKTANMVVEVLEFFGYVSRIGEDIKIGKF
jgi:ParB family chromosome partitioning protein